jgi:hypothetical protein
MHLMKKNPVFSGKFIEIMITFSLTLFQNIYRVLWQNSWLLLQILQVTYLPHFLVHMEVLLSENHFRQSSCSIQFIIMSL